jgi:DinB superfamily
MGARTVDDKSSDTLVVVSGEGFWTGSSTLPHLHQMTVPARYSRPMNDERGDAPLYDLTDPALVRPLPGALAVARADVLAAARDLLAIPESALTKPWAWRPGSEEEVRYAAYRAGEALEQAEIEARTLAFSNDPGESQAARIVGPTTAARWDLHGLLVPLGETLLDADPGGGEWSLRLVLGHTIGSQRGYAWTAAWVQAHGFDATDRAAQVRVPEAFFDSMPDDQTTEAMGSLADLRARLDAILDLSSERLAGTPDELLQIPTRWSGFPVTLGFRYGRWSSHIREHTIQAEKTLALLGHIPSEPDRLVRLVLSAYGRAEAVVFGRETGDAAVARVAEGAAEVRRTIRSARDAAGA